MIPANSFDSKTKFLDKTRSSFGGGVFNVIDASIKDIENYYGYLKEQYYTGTPKEFYGVELIGLQSTGYWCLSREVR